MSQNYQFLLLVTFLLTGKLLAQPFPIEWEEIPIEDLKMTSYPADSSASALILCDFGETKLNDELWLVYMRHLRIKILNENGYDWGTHSVNIYEGKYGERLDDIEAMTYSLDENGEIIETELDDDDIFEEEVTDSRTKFTFSMPALKPGCIIDIKYKIIAESLWYIRGWTFQRDVPVLWSEYRLTYPQNIAFASVMIGYEPWEVNQYNEVSQVFSGSASALVGKMAKCHSYRWAVKNAPALRDEPYVTTVNDYANKIDLQLAAYTFGTGTKHVLHNWQTVVEELIDNNNFYGRIDPGDVEDLTKDITKDLSTPEEKMKAIYNWITKSIVWSGSNRLFPEYDVDETIEYKKGNNADITMLLISMLKSAGIEGEPVIASTRSNGKIQEVYPIVSQFDYVLTRVKLSGNIYFLDATDPLRNFGTLPVKVLNVRGLVIKPGKPEWVVLSSKIKNDNITVINIQLNTDGTFKANFECRLGEYSGISSRKDCQGKKDLEFVKEEFDIESLGFTIDSTIVLNKDSIHLPLKIQTVISAENYSQVGGDLIYLNPNLLNRLTDNPFKAELRKFPIDYAYPRTETIITNITIPIDYELKEAYDNKTYSVSSNASFKRMMQNEDNIIQIMSKMEIKQSEIKPNFYKKLKEFYSQIISAQNEMLVIGPKKSG